MFLHADDFETGKTSYHYEVHGDDGRVTGLELHIQPETLQSRHEDRRVRARACADSGDIEATPRRHLRAAAGDDGDDAAASATALEVVTTKATVTHSVLVTLLKFADTPTDPMPARRRSR